MILNKYSQEASTRCDEYENTLKRCLESVPTEEAPVAIISNDHKAICDLSVEIIVELILLIRTLNL